MIKQLFVLLIIYYINFSIIKGTYVSSVGQIDILNGLKFNITGIVHNGRCDINGDGYDDLIFSSDSDTIYYTKVVIFFGPSSRYTNFDVYENDYMDGVKGFKIKIQSYKRILCSDLNNDGIDDLIVSTRYSAAGGIFVLYGHVGNFPPSIDYLTYTDGANGFRILGVNQESLGSSKTVADINDDGIMDLIFLAAPGNYPSPVNPPLGDPFTYILYGIDNGDKYPTNSNGEFDINSIKSGNSGFYIPLTSTYVAAIDMNSDGIDDLVFYKSTDSYKIVYGRASPSFPSPYVLDLNGINGFTITSPIGTGSADEGDSYIKSGDFNGDGVKDSIIKNRDSTGRVTVYVLYGNSSNVYPAIVNLDNYIDGIRGRKYMSGLSTDYYCQTLEVEDINNDGMADITCFALLNNIVWSVYGTNIPYPVISNIESTNSPTNSQCKGFKITGLTQNYSLLNLNFKNKTGTKDLVIGIKNSIFLTYYGSGPQKSDFIINNSTLNIHQLEYNQTKPNDYGIQFLLNNYQITNNECPIESITVSILNALNGDSFQLNDSDPTSYQINQISNSKIQIINLNSTFSFLDFVSNINFYKDSSITNSTSTSNIEISFNNRVENILINIIRTSIPPETPPPSSSDSSNHSSTSSNETSSSVSSSSSRETSSSSKSSNESNSSSSVGEDDKRNIGVIIGPVIGGFAVLVIAGIIIFFLIKRKKNKEKKSDIPLQKQASQTQVFIGGEIKKIDKF